MMQSYNPDPPASKLALGKSTHSEEAYAINEDCIRLLIFLQNKELQEQLIDGLNLNNEFMFHTTFDLSECMIAAAAETYQFLVTDIYDFGLDFSGALTKIKEDAKGPAIVLLTKETDHLKEIECLNEGADCVISGPLIVPLIIARIKAIMRWRNEKGDSSSKIGPFEFDMETKTLSNSQFDDINVTNKEARILKFLLSRKGKVVSRTDLLRHVWGYNSSADTHTVETHIYRLRKKIGKVVESKTIIITEVGGYRLVK